MSLKEQIEHRDKVLKMRNYHYENFNKWSTYFYIIVGALFVGYYSAIGKEETEAFQLLMLILGYIVSLCWYISNKGYYYWELHWVFFIQDIESKMPIKDRVFSVFYYTENDNKIKLDNGNYFCPIKEANVSTSKVNLLLSFIVALAWGYLLCAAILENICCLNIHCSCSCCLCRIWFVVLLIAPVVATILIGAGLGYLFRSDIKHTLCNYVYRDIPTREKIFDDITSKASELYFSDKKKITYDELMSIVNKNIKDDKAKYERIQPVVRPIGEYIESCFGLEISNSNVLKIGQIDKDIFKIIIDIVRDIKFNADTPMTCAELKEHLKTEYSGVIKRNLTDADVESYVRSVRAIIETSFKSKR